MSRHVCFVVYPGFVLLDLSGPLEAFANANRVSPSSYRFTVASEEGGLIAASSGVQMATEATSAVASIDTLIVVGSPAAPTGDWTAALAATIRRMSTHSRRTASVC